MSFFRQLRSPGLVFVSSLLVLFALLVSSVPVTTASGNEQKSADPWPSSQTLQPTQRRVLRITQEHPTPAILHADEAIDKR